MVVEIQYMQQEAWGTQDGSSGLSLNYGKESTANTGLSKHAS